MRYRTIKTNIKGVDYFPSSRKTEGAVLLFILRLHNAARTIIAALTLTREGKRYSAYA